MDDDTSSVSVLIRTADLGDRLPKIVTALDDQSLPYSRYQTVFLDPGSSDATTRRLQDLEQRRPNVRLLTGENASWRSAVESTTDDFVLRLGPADLLFPGGLAALLATAAAGHDLVLAPGGDSGPAGFVPDALTHGEPMDRSAPTSGIAVLAPFALVRREALLAVLPDGEPGLPLRQTRVRLLRSVGSVATCAVPVGVGSGPGHGESAQEIWADAARAAELLDDGDAAAWFIAAHAAAALERTDGNQSTPGVDDQIIDLVQRHWKDRDPKALPFLQRRVVQALVERDLSAATAEGQAVSRLDLATTSASATWSSGVLNLMVNGTIGAAGDTVPDGATIRLSVRNPANSLQYDLPAESTVDPAADGTARFVAQSAVDIGRAAHGEPLAAGTWQILVRVTGVGASRPISAAVPFCAVTGAIVDGTPVSVFERDGRLQLDVGARRHGFLRTPYKPEQANVSQTAKGALLTIAAPDVVVHGDATIPSALYLGSFRLPAVLRASPDATLMECYVSGLAGVSKLDVKIGDAARQHLGLRLRIGAVGDMAVEASSPPAPRPKKAAKQPAIRPATSKPKSPAPGKATAGAGGAARTGPKQGGPKAKKRSGGTKRSGRVVNQLPEPLRPLARRVARSTTVRRLYRRVLRRG